MPTKETIKQITDLCRDASSEALVKALHERYGNDERSGVQKALAAMDKRIEKQRLERERVSLLYDFERKMRNDVGARLSVGLDEVGRGPLAGPLAIGAVVLNFDDDVIEGINDSKQVFHTKRAVVANEIMKRAIAYDVIFVDVSKIDEIGISNVLRMAFLQGIDSIEWQLAEKGYSKEDLGLVCLDGNPMRLDEREVNVVKGDAKCASIAAASIIAKEMRDALMVDMDERFPGYGFAKNKGYGSEDHINAIKENGLCELHRRSFCKNFVSS